MKRKAIVTILSLVMCLIMAFPAIAARSIVDTGNYISYMQNFRLEVENGSRFPSEYKYVMFVLYDMNPTGWIYYFVSNTPNINGAYSYLGIIRYDGRIESQWYSSTAKYTFKSNSLSSTGIYVFRNSDTTYFIEGLKGVFTEYSTANIPSDMYSYALSTKGYDLDIRLVSSVDTSELEALLSQAKATQNIGYTQSTWQSLQTQITDAENVLSDSNKTQAQVDNVKNSLQSALNGLELLPPPLPDTNELEELLVEADEIEDIGYTVPTWVRFDNARISGHMLLTRSDYTEPEVTATTFELRSSMDGLTLDVVIPPNPPAPLGYDLSTGDISGFLTVVPKIFYNYVVSAQPVLIGLFGIVLSILIIPRVLGIIIPHLRR